MSTSSNSFFVGWLGYGTAFSSLLLTEPADIAYTRRPIAYSPLDGATAHDFSVGTVGPASVAWGSLLFAGLFSAVTGGTLLAVIPLNRPDVVLAGMTVTDAQKFTFTLSGYNDLQGDTTSWVAGAELARTPARLSVVACQNLQVASGILVPLVTPNANLLTSLPLIAPPAGSGQLWNNGGVICIA